MDKRVLFFVVFIFCFSLNSKAVVTNWTGASGTNWFTTGNWSNGVPGANDDAQIGVANTYTNSPVINTSTTVKSLTFGVRSSGSLTVNNNITLTVTNDITLKYASASATIKILGQTVSGVLGATVTCGGNLYVGDNTAPVTPAQNGTINATYVATLYVAIQRFNVGGSLILNTTSASANVNAGLSSNVNNPVFGIYNGYMNVNQNLQITNSAYVNTALNGYTTATNTGRLIINPIDNTITGSASTIAFGGSINIATAGFLDFCGAGVGSSTVIYNGNTAQTVYTGDTNGLGVSPANYQNISFAGTGVKTIQSGTMTITGNWNSAGANIDAITNSSTADFIGTAQTLTDGGSNSGNGMVFNNVFFRGSGTKTLSSGKFSIGTSGVLTMGGTATLAAGGNLTLLSGSTSTATVAALPAGTSITGNVNVQRMIKGSPTDLTKRGYRFISSAVYTATVGGVKCFDLRYLLDSAYVSGMAGGGFNAPSTNPSLYLYREDVLQNTTVFNISHYKGIAKINNTNAYDIGTSKRLTTANVADTTINLPIGNGVLFFFRGNKSDNATQPGSKVSAPYDYPEDVTFTQTGQLNTGTVNVRPWYNFNNSANPNNYLPYTNSSSLNNAAIRGFVLVGNPYASTINWEKFNRNGANSSIYGGAFPAASVTQGKIWIYNPSSKQYDTYIQAPTISSVADTTTTVKPSGSIATGDASNMIASGQGFFIRATTTGQTFSFRETAKTSTQPTAANLIKVMNAPTSIASMSFASAAPAVKTPAYDLPMIGLRLVKDSINTDDVVLAFNNCTGIDFDAETDAEDLGGNGAQVSLSVITRDKKATAVKQLTLPQAGQQVINLMVDAAASGKYELKVKTMDNLPGYYKVLLKDNFINDSVEIKKNSTYSFDINKTNSGSYGSDRFKIIISTNKSKKAKLLSFKAEKAMKQAKLTWQIENEGNDFDFVVERSTDNGSTFKELGRITANNVGSYTFFDVQPVLGENVYRIKWQSAETGKDEYAPLAKLIYVENLTETAATSNISVYPNPAVDVLNIKIDQKTDKSKYAIKITNSFGLVIKELKSNQSNWQENISYLIPGTYLVKVINTTQNQIEGEAKFVKLR